MADNSGPAFPVTLEQKQQETMEYGSMTGLTIRQWYAGMALAGMNAWVESQIG